MEQLYKIGLIFLIAVVLQADAFRFNYEEDRAIKTQDSHALAGVSKSFTALKSVYDEAKITLEKLQMCGTTTHLELFQLVAAKLSDMQSCINATRVIVSYEEFLLHLYYYGKAIIFFVIDLVKRIVHCRYEPGFFQPLICIVSQLQKSGPQVDDLLITAEDLIVEVKNDTDSLVFYVKRCFSHNSTQFLSEMNTLINNNC